MQNFVHQRDTLFRLIKQSASFLLRAVKNPYIITISLFLIFVYGCNPSIELFKTDSRYYSIFGFLNASADTQYVRIEQLRDSMPNSSPDHLNITVKLTDLTAKQTSVLHDSLFHFDLGNVHNYYTTQKIMPGHQYRLVVAGANGNESSAQVWIPVTRPKLTVEAGIDPFFGLGCSAKNLIMAQVGIRGVKRLVAVNAVYYTERTDSHGKVVKTSYSLEHLSDTTNVGYEVRASINYHLDLCRTDIAYDKTAILDSVVVVVAAGNQDWPNFQALNTESEVIPGVATNVKNGVGLLGGVVTDTAVFYYRGQPTLFSH